MFLSIYLKIIKHSFTECIQSEGSNGNNDTSNSEYLAEMIELKMCREFFKATYPTRGSKEPSLFIQTLQELKLRTLVIE